MPQKEVQKIIKGGKTSYDVIRQKSWEISQIDYQEPCQILQMWTHSQPRVFGKKTKMVIRLALKEFLQKK